MLFGGQKASAQSAFNLKYLQIKQLSRGRAYKNLVKHPNHW